MTWHKIDSDAVAADGCAKAVELDLQANQAALVTERHVHLGVGYPSQGAKQPIFVTHPDHWQGYIVEIPYCEGARQVSLVLRYRCAFADVRARLKVGAQVGDEVTLGNSWDSFSDELTVDLPRDPPPGGVWRVQVLFQSEVAASATANLTVQVRGEHGAWVSVSTPTTLATGKAHHLLELGSTTYGDSNVHTRRFAVPRITESLDAAVVAAAGSNNAYDLFVWPYAPYGDIAWRLDGSTKDSATLYALGRVTLLGESWTLSGDNGQVPMQPRRVLSAGEALRAQALQQLDVGFGRLYRERVRLHCGLPGHGTAHYRGQLTEYHGGLGTTTTDIGGALVEQREDSIGVRVRLAFMPRRVYRTRMVLRVTLTGPVGTTTEEIEIEPDWHFGNLQSPYSPRTLPDGPGTLLALNLRSTPSAWGFADTLLEDEDDALQTFDLLIEWAAGSSVGDWHQLAVEVDDADLYMATLLAFEEVSIDE